MDQIVTIKDTTKSLNVAKKLSICETSIDKKDVIVVDSTGFMRVVLWRDPCEKQVAKDKT